MFKSLNVFANINKGFNLLNTKETNISYNFFQLNQIRFLLQTSLSQFQSQQELLAKDPNLNNDNIKDTIKYINRIAKDLMDNKLVVAKYLHAIARDLVLLRIINKLLKDPLNVNLWEDFVQRAITKMDFEQLWCCLNFIWFCIWILNNASHNFISAFIEARFFNRLLRIRNLNLNLKIFLNSVFTNLLFNRLAEINLNFRKIANVNWIQDAWTEIGNIKPKNSNKVFFNFMNFEVKNPANNLNDAIQNAALKFLNDVGFNFLNADKNAGVVVQVRAKMDDKWYSMTSYFSLTLPNLEAWFRYLEFTSQIKALKYDSVNDPTVLKEYTIAFNFRQVTEDDGAFTAAASKTNLLQKLRDLSTSINSAIHTGNWFSIWPKLMPQLYDWSQLKHAVIIKSKWKSSTYWVENIWILNPMRKPADEIAKLDENSFQLFNNEMAKISKVVQTPQLLERDYIRCTLQVNKLTDEIRTVRVFYNELQITEFMDQLLESNDENIVKFKRTFENGESIIVENNKITVQQQKDNPNVFMQNLAKTSWKDVCNMEFMTYDLETRFAKVIDPNGDIVLDKAGKPIKQLSVISYALHHNTMWTDRSELNATARFASILSHEGSQEKLMYNFLISTKRIAINALENVKGQRIMHLLAHNAARFDEIFLVKYLIKFLPRDDKLTFIFKDNKFISIDWIINGRLSEDIRKERKLKLTTIRFMDSYLMLPASLAKLAITFKVENKGNFNVVDIDENTNLSEILPQLAEYNMADARILWNIFAIYAEKSAKELNVNIFNSPTISSLAFRVFRTNYLDPKNHFINITDYQTYQDLKPAYTGGACDVYNPTNPKGSKIYYYDVNSEYPAMMAQNLMPTGNMVRVKGDVPWQDPTFCGFVCVDVECPTSIEVPILTQVHEGKCIAGVGTWTGIYFAEELRYAQSIGYIIHKTHGAFIMEGRLVFTNFINEIYAKRLAVPKSDPMNMIFKLIMNSTYGRFGMSPELSDVRLLDVNGTHNYKSGTLFDEIKLFNEETVMVISKQNKNTDLIADNPNQNLQISLPIAAATTSYARINIHRIKLQAALLGVLLYSDTDSVVCSQPLPDSLLGKGLGQLKLECTADRGIFLAPKVYALKNVYEGEKSIGNIIKAKGLANTQGLTFEIFEQLLDLNNSYSSFQTKWFRQPENATIIIKDLSNIMKITTGKRVLITDHNDTFISTTSIQFKDGKIVSPKIIKTGLPVPYIPREEFILVNDIIILGAPKPILLISAPSSTEGEGEGSGSLPPSGSIPPSSGGRGGGIIPPTSLNIAPSMDYQPDDSDIDNMIIESWSTESKSSNNDFFN